MNIAQDFENARRFLKWSLQDVSEKLDRRYSLGFLEQVHRGEPYPEVKDALEQLYVAAFAEKAVDIVLEGSPYPYRVYVALNERFIQFVHRKNLSLGDAKALSESVSNVGFRELLKDASTIEIHWEKVLEAIIRERNKSEQGRLFESVHEKITHSNTQISFVSDLPKPSNQPKRDPEAVLAECNTCHKPRPRDRYSVQTCACPNDDYL